MPLGEGFGELRIHFEPRERGDFENVGVLPGHIVAFGEIRVHERCCNVVLNAHFGLQNMLERSAHVAAGVQGGGARDAHRHALDLAGSQPLALCDCERSLSCRLSEVARRYGLEKHRQNLGSIGKELGNIRF